MLVADVHPFKLDLMRNEELLNYILRLLVLTKKLLSISPTYSLLDTTEGLLQIYHIFKGGEIMSRGGKLAPEVNRSVTAGIRFFFDKEYGVDPQPVGHYL